MNLSPLCCGSWDGANLWLQWTPADAPLGYLVRVRLRAAADRPWDAWKLIGGAVPLTRAWTVVKTMRDGWQIQAQVRVKSEAAHAAQDAAGDEAAQQREGEALLRWETATEVTFARSTARFSFAWQATAQQKSLEIVRGTIFSAMVDRAGCSYLLKEVALPEGAFDTLVLTPGTTTECELEALHLSAWCQLDNPRDFLARPVAGLTVTNVTPSVNDLTPTVPAQDFTTLAKAHPGGPGVLVSTGRKSALPT